MEGKGSIWGCGRVGQIRNGHLRSREAVGSLEAIACLPYRNIYIRKDIYIHIYPFFKYYCCKVT